MKYLFFDIECAGVYKTKAKICAFGYCLTDEQFHILEKRDILINPQGGFHLTDRKGRQGLVLPYEYDEFKKYPIFPEYAAEIYALIQDRDTLVCGHATMNDVKYLNLESQRFSLPPFDFSFADTQFLYMNRVGVFNRQFALGTIAEDLGVEFTAHRAADDAYATMKVAEAMCKEENCSLIELIARYQVTLGKIQNYEITQGTSAAFDAYHEEAAKKKLAREKARAKFHSFVDRTRRRRNKDGDLKDLKVSFSYAVEEDGELCKKLVTLLFERGGYYCYHPGEANTFVCKAGETSGRRKSAEENGATVLSDEEFLQFLLGV